MAKHISCPRKKQEGGGRFAFVALDGVKRGRGMGMGEKKPVEITENSSDQAKNKAENNPWVLLFLYTDFFLFFSSKIRVLHLLIA